jgi:hypothetical protein
MSCFVCACVQDFNPRQEKVIWRQQREYWGTWSVHKMLVYDISKQQSLNLLDIRTPTMRDARLKGRAPRAHVNCWEYHLFHGHQRSKIVCIINRRSQIHIHGSYCAQILWMKATLNDIKIKFKKVSLLCDNESAIKLTNNPVQHTRTKHIDVHHHFIRDHQQKGDICIESVGTEDQLVDIFAKPLDEKRFCKLRNVLNILDFSNMCWCTPTYMTYLSFELPR